MGRGSRGAPVRSAALEYPSIRATAIEAEGELVEVFVFGVFMAPIMILGIFGGPLRLAGWWLWHANANVSEIVKGCHDRKVSLSSAFPVLKQPIRLPRYRAPDCQDGDKAIKA
jgi:hypothetical protein